MQVDEFKRFIDIIAKATKKIPKEKIGLHEAQTAMKKLKRKFSTNELAAYYYILILFVKRNEYGQYRGVGEVAYLLEISINTARDWTLPGRCDTRFIVFCQS